MDHLLGHVEGAGFGDDEALDGEDDQYEDDE